MRPSRWAATFILAICALVALGAVGECNNDQGFGLENNASGAYFKPNWTPDGAHIVFDRYVVDVGGTNLRSIVPDSQMGGEFDLQTSTSVSRVEPMVAYTTLRHGNGIPVFRSYSWDIVTSALDGSSYERLTSEGSREVSPIWSPDSARIAFFSDRHTQFWGQFNLFVMDRDGSNVRNLTRHLEVVNEPVVWSPAGERIAFWVKEMKRETDGIEYPYDNVLHVIDSDGSNMQIVNRTASHVAWSPDGQHLAFVEKFTYDATEDTPIIVIASVIGEPSGRAIMIDPPPELPGEYITRAGALTWSADGTGILFVTCHDPGDSRVHSFNADSRVYSLNADESASLQLVGRWLEIDRCPITPGYGMAWSPDRSMIAVWTDQEWQTFARLAHNPEIFVISPDGTNYRELVVRGSDWEPIAANAKRQQFTDDVSACSQGFVVPGGSLYEGLVRDC